MRLYFGPDDLGAFQLSIAGAHNLVNAAIALAIALESGARLEDLRNALTEFDGVDRRLTVKYQSPVFTVLDDYGHHPTELRATIAAARESYAGGGRRLVVVFQPHQHSRTRVLFDEFVEALSAADRVVLTDIFAARDTAEDRASVSSAQLAEALTAKGVDAVSAGSLADTAEAVWSTTSPGDVVLTSGAGDVDKVADELVRRSARG
jgi:UDP-N-acetylmuramate--alanine ligase